MSLQVSAQTVYFVKTSQSQQPVGCYMGEALARKVSEFVYECSWERFPGGLIVGKEGFVAQMLKIEDGWVLLNRDSFGKLIEVGTVFNPDHCIQHVENLERQLPKLKTPEPASPSKEIVPNGAEEKVFIWEVKTRCAPYQKWEWFGFYRSHDLARRVSQFVRDCIFGKFGGGVDVIADEDPYCEMSLKTPAGWRLKNTDERIYFITEEFNPKECIERVRLMQESFTFKK